MPHFYLIECFVQMALQTNRKIPLRESFTATPSTTQLALTSGVGTKAVNSSSAITSNHGMGGTSVHMKNLQAINQSSFRSMSTDYERNSDANKTLSAKTKRKAGDIDSVPLSLATSTGRIAPVLSSPSLTRTFIDETEGAEKRHLKQKQQFSASEKVNRYFLLMEREIFDLFRSNTSTIQNYEQQRVQYLETISSFENWSINVTTFVETTPSLSHDTLTSTGDGSFIVDPNTLPIAFQNLPSAAYEYRSRFSPGFVIPVIGWKKKCYDYEKTLKRIELIRFLERDRFKVKPTANISSSASANTEAFISGIQSSVILAATAVHGGLAQFVRDDLTSLPEGVDEAGIERVIRVLKRSLDRYEVKKNEPWYRALPAEFQSNHIISNMPAVPGKSLEDVALLRFEHNMVIVDQQQMAKLVASRPSRSISNLSSTVIDANADY